MQRTKFVCKDTDNLDNTLYYTVLYCTSKNAAEVKNSQYS